MSSLGRRGGISQAYSTRDDEGVDEPANAAESATPFWNRKTKSERPRPLRLAEAFDIKKKLS
jgi:hypothetical protein